MSSISVVIPTFNRNEVLGRAISSVLNQTLLPQELIVIDDGSTDKSGEFVRREFPQVKYIKQDNRGVSAARNSGIHIAQGDWIALLDSDDEWLPNKLERQMSVLQDATKEKVCHTEEIWIRNGIRVNQMKKHKKVGGHIYQSCLPLCAMSPSSIIIHREVFSQVGLFDESLPACEDYDLWLKICARFPVAFIEEPMIVKHGGHEDQLSRRYWGMDRFRVRSLAHMLRSEDLGREDKAATLEMLNYKLTILLQGAAKHNNQELIEFCQRLQAEFSP